MSANRTYDEYREPDELIIPSEDGFVVIPTNSVRVRESSGRQVEKSLASWRSYRLGNILQFGLMLSAMVALMAFVGYFIAGVAGLAIMVVVGGTGFLVSSGAGVDRLLRARHLAYIDKERGYRLYRMASELAEKAGLEKIPALFLDRRANINAYTVEDKKRAAVVLSEQLLNSLNPRELRAVLAHEMAHLKNRDIGIMHFSDQVRRLTGFMAIAGQLLLVLYLPLLLINGVSVPWSLLLVMIAAPTVSSLIQVALSRNREFRADLDAVALTGDAAGLASALQKINIQDSFWQKLYAPYLREIPELLRTHPNTAARIQRLRNIQQERDYEPAWET